jgi:hypothetical protein
MKVFLYISILTLALSSAVLAETTQPEKDPFFPPERGLLAPATPSAEDGWGRDPFASPLAEKTPSLAGGVNGRKISGIIYSRRSRVVVIGGDMLQEGSMVGDRRIVEIRKRSVVFQNASGGYEEVYLDDFSIGK